MYSAAISHFEAHWTIWDGVGGHIGPTLDHIGPDEMRIKNPSFFPRLASKSNESSRTGVEGAGPLANERRRRNFSRFALRHARSHLGPPRSPIPRTRRTARTTPLIDHPPRHELHANFKACRPRRSPPPRQPWRPCPTASRSSHPWSKNQD